VEHLGARNRHGLQTVFRALAHVPLVILLLALGTIADTPLFAVLFEMAPPPLPATVTDRDASLTVTTHDDHGEAIRGARVEVLTDIDDKVYRAGGGRTDANGVAKIPSLPRGHAWIVADAEGHARSSTSLVLIGDRSVELVLGPEHAFVVNVVDPEGRGVANAEIEVSGADPLPYGARTDAQGRAEVHRLGESPWVVTARALGYDESTARGVRDGAAIKLVLHRLGSITVHVVDAQDKPVQNARVRIAGTALWPSREGHTGPKGGVKLAGLFAGSYALRATEGTRASAIEIGIMLAAGEDQEMTLHLLPGRMVTVHVTDGDADDADDVSGARVVLAESGLSPFPLEAVTDKRGRATLGPIAAGPATVSARADGYVGKSAVNVPEPLAGEVRVILAKAGTLVGRVVDARGYPVASATIELVGSDFSGGPIDDDPRRNDFKEAQFAAALPGPAQLVPAGELGVVPGPVPPIPRGPASFGSQLTPSGQRRAEPWVTAGDGTFRASPATPGRVRALVRHPEYVEAWSDLVTIPPGGEAHVEIVLRAGGSLEGRVVDAQGRPAPNVRVELAATHGTLERSTRTASDGTFAFAAVPREISLDVFDSEDATSPALRTTAVVETGERKEITLTLPAAREAMTVRVRDDRGYPVASAQVSIASLESSAPLRETGFTDARGETVLAGARGLPLRIETTAPGHAPKVQTVDSAPETLDVALDLGASFSATLRGSRGAPIEGADVVLYTSSIVRHLRSDARGSTDAADLAPGAARIVVRAPGFATTEKSFTLPAALGNVDLEAESVIEGDVRDERADPVAGARVAKDRVPVFLAQGTTPPDVATTDARGHFRLGGLAAGTVALEAYAPDVGRGRADNIRVSPGRPTTNVRITLGGGRAPNEGAGATVAVTLGEAVSGNVREVVIVLVAAGSEAERAGLEPNDTLAEVDGTPVHTIEEARAKLGGPAGMDAVLTIKRGETTSRVRVGREIVRR
jgi:hypothetical protein